ncbi:MAG TPA: thioredoxin family protein [Acidobacteriota bacterium]|nr:thioredoxin family protein [Acidobacteriota bacterium]
MSKISDTQLQNHKIVSPAEWLSARKELLAKEKEFTQLREELSQQRRDLPWEKVEKSYQFDGLDGKESLADLFQKRNQLIVYHFMFNPEWDEGCPSCSFWADHYDAMVPHLNQRDVAFVVISRAPLAKIQAFKKRMGWKFKWLSSGNGDFNYDYHVSFRPEDLKRKSIVYNYEESAAQHPDREGLSVFYKDKKGNVYHTYSAYARGIDMVNATYQFLDLVPKGRDEEGDFKQAWVNYHDRYDQ